MVEVVFCLIVGACVGFMVFAVFSVNRRNNTPKDSE